MLITLADFDIWWGVSAKESEKNKIKEGGGGRVFNRFGSHTHIYIYFLNKLRL